LPEGQEIPAKNHHQKPTFLGGKEEQKKKKKSQQPICWLATHRVVVT